MSDASTSHVARIGETAGLVWQLLHDNGSMNLTQILKAVDRPRDEVMQAIGWLAREDKLLFTDKARARWVSLKEGQ